jgi:hypothetical protein
MVPAAEEVVGAVSTSSVIGRRRAGLIGAGKGFDELI